MKILGGLLIIQILIFGIIEGRGQTCSEGVSVGVNLVTNGDFSNGYTGWTYDTTYYTAFTACGSSCFSVPGRIYVGTTPTMFNSAFSDPAQPGNPFLMVDGVCTAGIDLWKQTNIPVVAGFTYYFTVQVTSLDATSESAPGVLQFVINGAAQATTITANQAPPGTWQQYSATWVANVTGNIAIEVQNITTLNCSNGVDFGVDNITFTPGCITGSKGPVPNLGPDFSICGKITPFNINPNFNAATQASANVTYTWYKNGTQMATGSGSGFYNYSVSSAGSYQVCVDSSGACTKSDLIVISSTYSINLGGPYTLCTPATQILNAGYTGPGVTYQWYLNGTAITDTISGAKAETYTVTSPGTYYVIVNDPLCGQQQGSAVVTSNVPIPVNGFFCNVSGTGSMSVIGTGDYYWFSAPTGGTALNSTASNSYNASGLTGAGPYTFYVQDSTPTSLHVGPPVMGNGFINLAGGGIMPASPATSSSTNLLIFNALTVFVLDSITVLPYVYSCPTSGTAYNINFIITNSAGATVGTSTYAVPASQCVNAGGVAPAMQIPVGITVPAGTGYKLQLNTGSAPVALYLNTENGGAEPTPRLYTYPTTYSSAVTFVSNYASTSGFNVYNYPDAIPGYLNWQITKFPPCGRVPVTVTKNCVAPVKFVDFDAKNMGSSVLLIWQTASEQNSDYFSVEKSGDGVNFNSIGTVGAAGNSENILSYSFIDRNLSDGNSYYRIVEYDKNGNTTSSSIKSVDVNNNNDLVVMPNPNGGNFIITGKTTANTPIDISIINSLGQQLFELVSQSEQENFSQNINISNLPSGIYYLQVQSADNSWVKKVVKE